VAEQLFQWKTVIIMADHWTIEEIEDALSKLPVPPARSRICYDQHGIPYVTLTVKVRGDLYAKCKILNIGFTETLQKVLIRLFRLGTPLKKDQQNIDGAIEEYASLEENKYQKSLIEIEEKDQKINIIKSAFGDGDLSKYRRYLPENDTHNTYISWWTEIASKLTAASNIPITEKDLTDYIREALKCQQQ